MGDKEEREKERERYFQMLNHSPKWLQYPGLSQAEARILEFTKSHPWMAEP